MRELTLLHFSDLHLGVEGYGRIDPKTGLSTRLQDCLSALDTVVEDAIASKVDLVLFTGDAYKNRDPSPTHQRELAKRIGRLVRAGIPIYLLVGNHDLPNSAARAHSVEIFHTLQLPNVHVVARGKLTTIETPSGPVQVFGVPWIFRSSVYKAEDNRELSIDEVHRRIRQLIFEGVGEAADALRRDIPAILAVHGHVDGATIGAESVSTLGQDYRIVMSDLWPNRWDYIALGHIHKHQTMHRNPPAVYAGSLFRTDFSEEREPKGYVRVTIRPRDSTLPEDRPFEADWRFVELERSRRFVTIKVNAEASDTPTEDVLAAIERQADAVRDAIVRVLVDLSPDNEDRFRETEIRRALREASFIAGVRRQVDRSARTRLPRDVGIEQLSPREAMEKYFLVKNVPAARRETLLAQVDALLAERAQAE